jgi:hypothetical protein
MHPRNPYRTPPDFKELALKFPEFRKHAKQVIIINFFIKKKPGCEEVIKINMLVFFLLIHHRNLQAKLR